MPIVSYPCPFCQLLFLLNKGFPDQFALHPPPAKQGYGLFHKKAWRQAFSLDFFNKIHYNI